MASVLVIDDDVDTATVLTKLLVRLGHSAQYATDAKSAVQMCVTSRPEIAFVDLFMPECDGFAVAAAIHAACPRVRLVALTGAHPSRWQQDGPFECYILKPASIESLLEVIGDS